MMILLHVLSALLSIGYTTYTFFRPSPARLKVAGSLAALTLASGTYLVCTQPAHLAQACLSGLLYTGGVAGGLLVARHKLIALDARD